MILDTTINKLIHCKTYHQRLLNFGERVWTAKGKKLEVIYWDLGNGWCLPIQILPKNRILNDEFKVQSLKFFQELQRIKDQ